jgi:hypothetical protein
MVGSRRPRRCCWRRAGEEEHVLRHHREAPPQLGPRQRRGRPCRARAPRRSDLVEAQQQRGHGALAGARRADDRDLLAPTPPATAHVAQHGDARLVLERDVVSSKAAVRGRARRRRGLPTSPLHRGGGVFVLVLLSSSSNTRSAPAIADWRACSAPRDRGSARRTCRCTRRTRTASRTLTCDACERHAREPEDGAMQTLETISIAASSDAS